LVFTVGEGGGESCMEGGERTHRRMSFRKEGVGKKSVKPT